MEYLSWSEQWRHFLDEMDETKRIVLHKIELLEVLAFFLTFGLHARRRRHSKLYESDTKTRHGADKAIGESQCLTCEGKVMPGREIDLVSAPVISLVFIFTFFEERFVELNDEYASQVSCMTRLINELGVVGVWSGMTGRIEH